MDQNLERVAALRTLIEIDQQTLGNFHAAGCPSDFADTAREAFQRVQKYRAELEKMAGLAPV